MAFRQDINGLRALAVVAVVIFHFFPALLPGGFAGVDVFFVISGFLMTKIIFTGLTDGSFSLGRFYLARINRIIPALAALCLVLLLFGWFYLTPLDYKQLGRHIAGSLGFVSNLVYWREAGYFDAASHEKWLLHTWSLAVEWQFYLIYPLLLISLRKICSVNALRYGVLAATFIGFGYGLVASYLWPTAGYYMLPSRAWEMLAGGVAYLFPIALLAQYQRITMLLGLLLIGGSYIAVSAADMWPGYLALLPVTGAFLVIQAQARQRLLWGNTLLQRLGLWSYSIYLWHWPLVVLSYYLSLDDSYRVGFIGLSVWFGYLSYRLIESRASLPAITIKGWRFNNSMLAALLLLSVAGVVNGLQGIDVRMSHVNAQVGVITEQVQRNPRDKECGRLQDGHSVSCRYGSGELGAIIIGDSHARAMVESIGEQAALQGKSVLDWGVSGCNTIAGLYRLRHGKKDPTCAVMIDDLITTAKAKYPGVPIVIINRMSQNLYGKNEDLQASPPDRFVGAIFSERNEQYRADIARAMVSTACTFAEHSPVYVVRPFPEMKQHVPNIMARTLLASNRHTRVKIPLAEYHSRQQLAFQIQDQMAAQCAVQILDPLASFCDEQYCYGDIGGKPLYFDDNHLSKFGAEVAATIFAPLWAPTS